MRHAGTLILVLIVYFGMSAYQTSGAASGEAPPIDALTINGEGFSLSTLRGQPVLVHFWASWCPSCRMMEEQLATVANAEDYQVITVAVRSGQPVALRAYLEEAAVEFPVIADANGALASTYGVTALPTSFYVDADGQIHGTEVGMSSAWGMKVRLWWAGL